MPSFRDTFAQVVVQALCLFSPIAAVAQGGDLQFRHISLADGLPNTVVVAAVRDSLGLIWIGTEDGLARFDGAEWVVFRADPDDPTTLSDSRVSALFQADRSTLLVGTENGGLNRIDMTTRRVQRIRLVRPDDSALQGRVTDIAPGRHGLLVAYGQDGIGRYRDADGTVLKISIEGPLPSGSMVVWKVLEDDAGRIWLGTWKSGLVALEPVDGSGFRYRVAPRLAPDVPGGRVRALLSDPDGSIIIGTSGGGVLRWYPETRQLDRWDVAEGMSDNRVFCLLMDRARVLWVGTFGGGLNRIAPDGSVRVIRHDPSDAGSLANDVINTMVIDGSNTLWVGTDAGLDFTDLDQDRFVTSGRLEGDEKILALTGCAADAGCLLVATNKGVRKVDYTEGKFEVGSLREIDEVSQAVSSITDAPGAILLSTRDRGLFVADGNRYREVELPALQDGRAHSIRDVVVDSHGMAWVGTDGAGLLILDRELSIRNQVIDTTGRSGHNHVSSLLSDGGGVWIGTFAGRVFHMDGPDSPLEPIYPAPDRSAPGKVMDLAPGHESSLWVAYEDRLVRLTKDGIVLETLERGEHLPTEAVKLLSAGGDSVLWMVTDSYLVGIAPGRSPVAFEHGLSGDGPAPFRGMISRRGLLSVLAAEGGLHGFNPAELLPAERWSPGLVLTRVAAGTQTLAVDVAEGRAIALPTAATGFSFSVAYPGFPSDETGYISYRLDGFEDGWHRLEGLHGELTYSNGSGRSGRFTLQLDARSANGRSSQLAVPILIPTVWWRSSAFLSLLGIALVGFVSAAVLDRARARRERVREVKRLLNSGNERQREAFARVIHDNALQELYILRMRLELAKSRFASIGESVDELNEAVDRAVARLREICIDLRPASIPGGQLGGAIRTHLDTILDRYPMVSIELQVVEMPDLDSQVGSALYQVFVNAVGNAVRHSGCKTVSIGLVRLRYKVVLTVKDDGHGFDIPSDWLELARTGHFGFLGMSECMNDVGGTLDVVSMPGVGTTVRASAALLPRRFIHGLWRSGAERRNDTSGT